MNDVSVLIVDDSDDFRQVAALFLRLLPGLRVVGSAADGVSALADAAQSQPDLVLIDLNMPRLSGLETIPQLRRLLPDAGIIALTMMEASTHRQPTLDAGANEFISKAEMETALLPAIERWLRQRQPAC